MKLKVFFHPMLAASLPVDVDLRSLPYPLLASYKLDGVRATKQQNEGPLISRNDELIPNKHVQKLFKFVPEGFDGELGCGEPTAPDFFRKTMSAVMSVEGTPDVQYYIFGTYDCSYTFEQRQKLLNEWFRMYRGSKALANLRLVEQVEVRNAFELETFEKQALKLGYEGVMLASKTGKYKQGGKHPRSTLREFYLVKLKRFAHGEALVLGVEEQMHNANEKDARGKRSTVKSGMKPKGVLGALQVRDRVTKVEFSIGTGFSDEERRVLWVQAENASVQSPIGKIVRYSYFPTGSKTKPRFPVFEGFRDKRDL